MLRKPDYNVHIDFSQPVVPSAEEITSRIVDVDTGEVLYSSSKTCAFACVANGEGYLKNLFDCYVRGLRTGRNLYLEITATPVHKNSIVQAAFNFSDGTDVSA